MAGLVLRIPECKSGSALWLYFCATLMKHSQVFSSRSPLIPVFNLRVIKHLPLCVHSSGTNDSCSFEHQHIEFHSIPPRLHEILSRITQRDRESQPWAVRSPTGECQTLHGAGEEMGVSEGEAQNSVSYGQGESIKSCFAGSGRQLWTRGCRYFQRTFLLVSSE